MRKRTLALVVAGGAGLVLLAVVTVGAAVFYAHFHDRGLPRTTVAGQSITGQTRGEVAASLRERSADVTVTWTADGAERTATLGDLGLAVDVDATVDEAFARNASWGGHLGVLVGGHKVAAVVTSDGTTLEDVAAQIATEAGLAGSDAAVVLAEDGTTFQVIPAVAGQAVDPSTFQEVARAAAAGLADRSTTVKFVPAAPTVTDQAAQQTVDAANALVAAPVVVSDGKADHSPEPAAQAAWVTIPTTPQGLGDPGLDLDQVTGWVQGLADEARLDPVTGQQYVDPQGKVLSITKQAKDGQEVTNVEQVAQAITDQVPAGQGYTGAFEFASVPATWDSKQVASAADVLAYFPSDGEKWIDVNLSNHTVRAYEGTTVVMGPYSMVDGKPAMPTVTGTFTIYQKYESKTMRGFEADGVTPYVTENVPWSMFFHKGYAIHGAYWRSTFGYSASHGCVNLPVATAKQLYQWAPVGTVVVVHR
ncbi:MAG: L,D-transpeptidase/peptidoglycan binding protein [Micrococcales bacterium]|nr:L,D-transpeptidase/peptidoglycan binding protein [Micrococcales bacterium]